MYKYDTHVHTLETSWCSKIAASEAVRLYSEAGYKGIVITDHYTKEFFDSIEGSWEEKVKRYLLGFYSAAREGKETGLKIILGVELRIYGSANDYLLFGATEEFFINNPGLYDMPLERLKPLLERHGILIFQAHPFRQWMTRALPSLLDGAEVYNGHHRQDSANHLALEFAKDNHLIMLSGSDCHHPADVGRGGIILPTAPQNSAELAAAIKTENYELITTP